MRIGILAGVVTLSVGSALTAQVRVFMAAEGRQQVAPPAGPTYHAVQPGATVQLMAWFQDTTIAEDCLEGYQLVFPYIAQPLGAACGQVTYVDRDPGADAGDSIFIDTQRADFIFEDSVILDPVYVEVPESGYFGTFYATVPGIPCGLGPSIHYVCQFEYTVPKDACGRFRVPFRLAPERPPLSTFFTPGGTTYFVDEYQDLILTVGEPAPEISEPPDGAIDPRCAVVEGKPVGPDQITVFFDGPVTISDTDEWSVHVTGEDESPVVDGVLLDGPMVTLQLSRPVTLGACTTLTHLPTAWDTQIRSLPGDVSGDGTANPGDILTLIDQLNGTIELAHWQCDVDLSGVCNGQDILALIDILNGARGHEPVTLPDCP